MKTYEPRRNNECPNGIHPDYNPALDPTQNECTCPWLVIASSTPVQHLTSWSRRELENVIRETDRGYFDPPGTPLRKNSMFLSPNLQRLVDMAEKEPVAAALTLLAGAAAHGDSGLPPFDAIAWDAEDACLSLRSGARGWRLLWLGHSNVDAVTNQSDQFAGGANPVLLWAEHADTYDEICTAEGIPTARWAHSTMHVEEGVTDPDIEFLKAHTDVVVEHPAQDYFPIFDEAAAAVEALPRRVPQVPSAIAEAAAYVAFDDRCATPVRVLFDDADPSTAYCEKLRGHLSAHGGEGFAWSPDELEITAPRDRWAQACGWALVDNGGTSVCALPTGHGNNHSDGDRIWYDSGTDDCTCATRGGAPDTYACPEHPADNV